jgi:hypothetical protein
MCFSYIHAPYEHDSLTKPTVGASASTAAFLDKVPGSKNKTRFQWHDPGFGVLGLRTGEIVSERYRVKTEKYFSEKYL